MPFLGQRQGWAGSAKKHLFQTSRIIYVSQWKSGVRGLRQPLYSGRRNWIRLNYTSRTIAILFIMHTSNWKSHGGQIASLLQSLNLLLSSTPKPFPPSRALKHNSDGFSFPKTNSKFPQTGTHTRTHVQASTTTHAHVESKHQQEHHVPPSPVES